MKGRAVVIGGGMGGLVTAEVLSKHFSEVLLLERDQPQSVWDENAVAMAEYNQVHAMTAKGLSVVDEVFGGRFITALKDGGGNVVDMSSAVLYFHPDCGPLPWQRNHQPQQPLMSAMCSRHLIETTARKLLVTNPKVLVKYGSAVTGLMFDNSSAAEGVEQPSSRSAGQSCTGAAVTGRGSALPSWLAAAGFVKLAPDVDNMLKQANLYGIVCVASPSEPTFGILFRQENDTWMAGLGGSNNIHPGRKDDELLEFAEQRLWTPVFGYLLKGSSLLAPACRFYGVNNTWRHYTELPDGIIPLADSVCSFSPVYAQGMSVAAIEAAALHQLLTQRQLKQAQADQMQEAGSVKWLEGLPRDFNKAILPIATEAWQFSAGNDQRFPGAASNEPKSSALLGTLLEGAMVGYLDNVFKLAGTDLQVQEALLRVLHMMDSPQILFQPSVAGKVVMLAVASLLTWPRNSKSNAAAAKAAGIYEHGKCPEPCGTLQQLLGVAS
eukprot:gene2252-2564_t